MSMWSRQPDYRRERMLLAVLVCLYCISVASVAAASDDSPLQRALDSTTLHDATTSSPSSQPVSAQAIYLPAHHDATTETATADWKSQASSPSISRLSSSIKPSNEATTSSHLHLQQQDPFTRQVRGGAAIPLNASIPSLSLVEVHGSQILVNGEPLFIKGVCYSPAPIGSNPLYQKPYGDYFTPVYAPLWHRDFPLMKLMGVNTVRIYGWNTSVDASEHLLFLNTLHEVGL